MLNKTELEKIEINFPGDLRPYDGKCISDKYIVMNCVVSDVMPDTLERCFVEGGGIVCRKAVKSRFCNMESVFAEEIKVSIFEKCRKIQCGEYDEGYKAMASQFFHCGEISINYAAAEDCIFNDFETLFLTGTSMHKCLFSGITCNSDCAVSMEDGEISGSCFEHIRLLDDSYLIEGIGDAYVNESVFMDIRTSRADREIFHMEEERGFIIKKTKEFSFVDEETCSGLALIADLDGNIDLGGLDIDLEKDDE